jgi:hypothetical protein
MIRRAGSRGVVAFLMLLSAVAADAQSRPTDTASLRASVERRFDVLPLRDGIALRPKSSTVRVRSIEIANGIIALDGRPVTGAELRTALGNDADLVLSLSYLSEDERRALSAPAGGAAAQALPPSSTNPSAPSNSGAPAASTPAPAPDVPAVAPPAPAPPAPRRGNGRRIRSSDDDRVNIGGSVTVREGEVVNGDVVAVGGSASVDGEVHGAVVSIGGNVTLGPNASVDEDVVTVGGRLTRDPASRVAGKISEIGLGNIDFTPWRFGRMWSVGSMFGSAFALAGTVLRLVILCLFCALVVLLGGSYAERAGVRAAQEPVKSWAIGFLAQLLFLPILVIGSVLLAITIIGIPLLFILVPLTLVGVCVVALVGFTGVARYVGHEVSARMNWVETSPYATTIVGIVVILTPLLLARLLGLAGGLVGPIAFGVAIIGLCVEYLAWTIGFGAMALTRFSPQAPPAAPVVVSGPVVPA